MQSLPVESRSRGVAIAYSGGSLGAVITPWIVTPIAAQYGWRGAFWFTGFVGLVWLITWSQVSRRPELSQVHRAQDSIGVTDRPGFTDKRLSSFMSLYALGGLPLALGAGTGSELRRPLGITIVGGLIVSQALTLFTTPVVYIYMDRLRLWAGRKGVARPGEAGPITPSPSAAD